MYVCMNGNEWGCTMSPWLGEWMTVSLCLSLDLIVHAYDTILSLRVSYMTNSISLLTCAT